VTKRETIIEKAHLLCLKSILVITEYLSKYPFAVPIRSKQAIEIADILLTYISIFDPPKIILNDNGGEFMNQIMECLLNMIGTEQRVTS
jgi:hypothetical protein